MSTDLRCRGRGRLGGLLLAHPLVDAAFEAADVPVAERLHVERRVLRELADAAADKH